MSASRLPGTVYNFGPDAFPLLAQDSPQQPLTRKGRIRVQMEEHLRDYAGRGGRVITVRAGDFFGPQAGNSWCAQGLVTPNQAVRSVYRPNSPGVGHAWGYLPDVARTMVLLLNRRQLLEPFACFHLAGHWDATGHDLVDCIVRVVARHGGRTPTIRALPWWLFTLAAPFSEAFRQMREMSYLWTQPIRMGGAKLKAVLGQEPHTPLEAAIETTQGGLGCLPA